MAVGPSPSTSSDRTGGGLARPQFVATIGLLISLGWALLLILQLTSVGQSVEPHLVAYQAIWLSVAVITAVVALVLMTRRRWAHQLLLALTSVRVSSAPLLSWWKQQRSPGKQACRLAGLMSPCR